MPTPAEIQQRRRKQPRPARRKAAAAGPVDELWPSIGGGVCDWIETYCVHGPGDVRGSDVTLTAEERRFIWRAYEVAPQGHPRAGRRRYNRAAYVRRKGVRKTELAAWLSLAELLGEVRCDGFDANGYPVARPVTSPYIPAAATTLEQSEDTLWGAIYAIASEGPVADEYSLDITQLGIVELETGGETKPVTSSSITRDGGKPTFSPRDETHLWFSSELRKLDATLLRNLAKRPIAEPWALATTTAWAPQQGSVAEAEHAEHELQRAGKLPADTILWDHLRAGDHHDLDTDEGLRAAIVEASGDALPWTDLDAIPKNFRAGTRAEGSRYWLSIPSAVTVDAGWLKDHPAAYEDCRETDISIDPHGAPVSVGVDAALRSDSVAVRTLQDRPDGTVASIAKTWLATDGRTYDRGALRNYLRDLAARYPIKAIGYDPRYFESDAQDLADEGLPMVEIPQSAERMVPACRIGYEMLVSRRLRHDDDEATSAQVIAGVAREADGGWRLSKGKSGQKIDAAIALCVAAYVHELVVVDSGDPTMDVW